MNARRTSRPVRLDPRRGSILFLVLVVSLLIVLTLAATVTTATATSRYTQFELNYVGALSVAEGATEVAQKGMLTAVADFKAPTLSGTVSIGGGSYPFAIVPIGGQVDRTNADGFTLAVQTYQITSTATLGTADARVCRIVDLTMTPIFQYMIFSQKDLEILPGPSMILGGKVHSNRNIYVGCDNTLTVDTNYFRSAGDILRKRKDDGTTPAGTVSIRVNDTSNYVPMTKDEDSRMSNWVDFALSTWQGTVQSSAHGVTEVAAPTIGSIQAFDANGEKGYYHSNADLVVRNGTAYDHDGNLVSLPAGTLVEKSMYDAREGKTVKVTEINVGLLNGSGRFPANGLIYAYRTDASSSQPNGIRLANAKQILRPLTVVSQDPVYLKGDFNTVEKKGVAVICDAIELLSNAWNDTKTAGKLPVAAATQYNVAIVTGNVPTPDGGGSYSGGFENLPRFHENWSGVKATIRGSFINIFESAFAKGKWVYGGDKYTAPNRDWQYDTDLLKMSNLPPFTPDAVYIQRVLWDDGLPMPLP